MGARRPPSMAPDGPETILPQRATQRRSSSKGGVQNHPFYMVLGGEWIKANNLIKDTKRNPFEGIGKPEPLKHNLAGYWSRRINEEDRMVYKVIDDTILIAQLRYHY